MSITVHRGSGSSAAGVTYPSAVNGNASTVPPGSPVYASSSTQFDLAKADAASTTKVLGLTRASVASGATGSIQTSDPLTLTTGEWDAVTGQSGGLTVNAFYYLSAATAGRLTTTAPSVSGQYIAPVGLAKSTTELVINFRPTIRRG